MKDKKIILLILGVLGILVFAIVYKNVNMNNLAADSGFDSSWDSGGSWGGSDWGGSSSWGGGSSHSSFDWDFDFGGSRSSHRSSSNPKNFNVPMSPMGFAIMVMAMILPIVLIFVVFYLISKHEKNRPIPKYNFEEHILKDNHEALENIMNQIPNFNKAEFYDYVYNNFVKIQEAWMNFNYDELRKLVTDELFNTYKSQLKTLEVKKQKNIMSDFFRTDIAIIKYEKTQNNHTITVKMSVKFYDYLVDNNGKVIRGTDKRRLHNTYVLTYVSGIDHDNKPNRCPNCNAPLDDSISSNICEYCRSTIINSSFDFLLSKKDIFEQRVE